MKVFLTGGAGFIGSHLVRQLLQVDHRVFVMDNVSSGAWRHLPARGNACTCWQMDIREASVKAKICKEKFDVIVHLAAQTMVDASIKDPIFDASENIMGTLNVLEVARQCGARVIFASTAAAYGDVVDTDLPVLETHELRPQSFYGLTKVGVEKYLDLYHELYGLDYVVCRFANVYGERQGDSGEGGVISIFAKRIVNGQDITIYGDGKQTRDFVYAGDIARGICKAMTTENVNTVYNLSTQTETTLLDLVKVMREVSGRDIVTHFGPQREGDIYRSMLSNQKAINGLGWMPEITLREGLKRTLEYFEQNK
ncbi:NAD-dependent epimerase/dehydratase family protein [Selenomonas sp. ND2010]|uniref:NAD-dependent epimerase/dehydratase family protein n=1 Tax=Selenomonas sp. ND2010 TaxID=1410618 RepID=UPI00051AC75D|nr:NAD-dependent epimerase/dehydratase family protein [Selenomonas sp. ND2010]